MEFEQLTEKIIGCAYTIYKQLGSGFLESVYEKSLLIELEKAGLRARSPVPIDVRYDGQFVGSFFADLLVEETVIIELKSVTKIIAAHEVQLVNYLAATGQCVGLILNVSPTGVEIKRKVRSLNSNPVHPVNPV